MRLGVVFEVLAIIVFLGGLLPLGAELWWGFELFTHFRVQYLLVAVTMLAIEIIRRKRILSVLLLTTAGVNAWPVLPYLAGGEASTEGPVVSVLNVNVNARNRDYPRIIDAIESQGADIVTVVELTPALDRVLAELDASYPYRFTIPAQCCFGIGVLSRYPLNDANGFRLISKAAIATDVELPSGSLRFLAVHLAPPMSEAMASERNQQLDLLAARLAGGSETTVVCGDFNLTPYSPHFRDFLRASGMTDVRRTTGLDVTWPTFNPILRIPIDHCLIAGGIGVESVENLDPIGSDHYPVAVTLRLTDVQ